MKQPRKDRHVQRLQRATAAAQGERDAERLRRIQAEAVLYQQKLILEFLTEQVANATCGFAFGVGLHNPDVVVPRFDDEKEEAA